MLDNSQLDRYLQARLRKLNYLPAASYQSVFSASNGNTKLLKPITGPTGFVANLDTTTGMGTHWVAIIFMPYSNPPTIYYYDPLLPNKEYQLPHEIREYFEAFQEKGGRIVMSMDVDQHPKLPDGVKPTDQGTRSNTMCGAYSAMMLLEMDKAALDPKTMTDKFYAYHDRLKKLQTVRLVYDRIQRGD